MRQHIALDFHHIARLAHSSSFGNRNSNNNNASEGRKEKNHHYLFRSLQPFVERMEDYSIITKWIDPRLTSPIHITELTRLYDSLLETLLVPTSRELYDTKHVTSYVILWLTCVLLEHAGKNMILSAEQLERVVETKKRCLLLLEVYDLFTETPLDALYAESIVVEDIDQRETLSFQNTLLSWNFQGATIDWDKDALAHEEMELITMANRSIPENYGPETQWQNLQERVRHAWGEIEYSRCLERSKAIA